MGTRSPSRKRGQSPFPQIFGPCLLWPTAGWINMALGMEVGLGPGHIVLDGDPAPFPKRGQSPSIFGLCLLWSNGWMDQDATLYGGRLQPRRHCVRWGPSPPPQKGGRAPQSSIFGPAKGAQQPFPLFGPCPLWPRSPISATSELLYRFCR